jgi:hypothetical protein
MLSDNLLILYFVLAGRFLTPLFPTNTSAFLADSALMRHILGFATVGIFCIAGKSALDDIMPMGTLLATTVVIYFWFLIASKMTANWWILLSLLFVALYFIDVYEEDAGIQKDLVTVKQVILGLSVVITAIGFVIYVGEKKLDYKSKFSYETLLLGTTPKGTPNIQPYWKSLQAAFMDVPRSYGLSGGFFDGIPPPPSSLPGDNF